MFFPILVDESRKMTVISKRFQERIDHKSVNAAVNNELRLLRYQNVALALRMAEECNTAFCDTGTLQRVYRPRPIRTADQLQVFPNTQDDDGDDYGADQDSSHEGPSGCCYDCDGYREDGYGYDYVEEYEDYDDYDRHWWYGE